ncbi:dienelactone hydrolase [Xaviernesmea oryzae]|uniref:Dienelactone hydrolase n=1 Tax=Xaviernesmea oryzae TaxID=464029 RepID=A0A1Q9B0M3_9HYPH|nr:dienelactone hydrolase [Xaviernesmea oryzae]
MTATFLALLAGFALPASAAAGPSAERHQVGVSKIEAPSRERGQPLSVTVWYPAEPGGTPVLSGDNAFFDGTPAWKDAPVAAGPYPLILLSHGAGLGGTPDAMSWMAAALADQGFIVAAPTHPGNGGAHRSAEQTIKLWLRPGDVGAALEAVQATPAFAGHLAPGTIGLLGLSMGGNTALAIAGARLDSERLAGYCDDDTRNASLCQWMRMSGVDLHRMDLSQAARDNRNRRIGFVMAIDPAPVDVFDPASFKAIDVPVVLVNLGRPDALQETVRADGIAAAIAGSSYATIDDASHFSLFPTCKAGAAEQAKAQEIDEPICADGGGRARTAIHAELVEMVAKAFKQGLGSNSQ